MSTVRLLHLADVHLDTAFDARSAPLRDHLRTAHRTAVERAVDCALDEKVDAVLVAGDLFDDQRLSIATEAFLVEQAERLAAADIDMVYATGNHDPGGSGFRASHIDWPDSVHNVDTRTPIRIELTGPDGAPCATVVAAGHVDAHEDANLAARFPAADGPGPTIGLLHAHVTSAAQADVHDRCAPCTLDDLRAPQYDYWALGHVHTRQRVDASVPAWYPGNLQGRSPREAGARGGLLVTVRPGEAPAVDFRPLAPTRWEDLVLDDLADVTTVQALVQTVGAAYRARARDAAAADWLLRVTLRGPCPLADVLDDPARVEEVEQGIARRLPDGVHDVKIRARRLVPPVDPDAYRDEAHLVGEVLALLDRIRTDDARLEDVAPDVLAGLPTDDPDARRDYLRSLLDGLDREAVARLVDESDTV